MNSAISPEDFEAHAPQLTPEKKRRGVSVVTAHGSALSFGVSQDRTKQMLQTLAARKYREVTAAMQEQKAARLKSRPAASSSHA